MKPFRLAALSLALLTTFTLVGCDNSDDKSQAAAPAASTASTSKAAEKPNAETLAKLAAQTQGKALTLLDTSEVQLDGAATLVLTFSVPLNPDQISPKRCMSWTRKAARLTGRGNLRLT